MKKLIKYSIVLFISIIISLASYSQPEPPDPTDNPNNSGGSELGGNASLSGGFVILMILGGFYASQKIYYLRKKDSKLIDN